MRVFLASASVPGLLIFLKAQKVTTQTFYNLDFCEKKWYFLSDIRLTCQTRSRNPVRHRFLVRPVSDFGLYTPWVQVNQRASPETIASWFRGSRNRHKVFLAKSDMSDVCQTQLFFQSREVRFRFITF